MRSASEAVQIRPIAQLHESFIIAVDDEGLLLIDQHVAHERILFDKFSQKENERKIESQNLLLPETIDLTPAQSAAFAEIEEDLENYGFGLMRLSGRTVAIKSIPTDLPPSEVRNLFAEILDTAREARIGMLIAAHHMAQITEPVVRDSIYTNTRLKFVARTSAALPALTQSMGTTDADLITTLNQYEFAFFGPNMH